MSSFRIASIAGIAIEVHWSWLFIFALVSWSTSEITLPDWYEDWSSTEYWVVGVAAALFLFVTVLVHELAHALVALRRGLPVPKITLFIFGGVSHLGRQPKSAGEEFAIAAAGPATSVAIAVVTGLLFFVARDRNEQAEALLLYLASVNVLLAFFNIIPGFPLDGGRVLRSIVWRKTQSFRRATQIASSTGQTVGFIMMVGGGLLLLAGGGLTGLWFIFIGWFLVGAARGEAEAMQIESLLARLTARDVMHGEWATVTPGMGIAGIVDEYMIGQGERAVVVANDGIVQGILTVNDIRRLPREQWGSTPAQSVMTPREAVVTVTGDTPASQVLMLMGQRGLNQIPVLEGGRMVGLITRRELIDRIQLVETLTPDGRG